MNYMMQLNSGVEINALAELLKKCSEVTKYDEGENNEAGAMAHAFSDIEKSFLTMFNEQIPRLKNGQLDAGEMYDLLLDIGEEFRHILYHINDLKFYQYLSNKE